MVPFLSSSIPALSVTLDAKNASEKHNALWFNPSFHRLTTIRLQFCIDDASSLQTMLRNALPGFSIRTADVVAKKVHVLAMTENGEAALDQGQVLFALACSVQPNGGSAVDMIASVEYHKTGISLTFQMNSPDEDTLSGILAWLTGLISKDLGIVKDILKRGGVFDDHVYLRRMKISLDTYDDVERPSLDSFGIDIEVKANFGKGPDVNPAAFLLTYSWSTGCEISRSMRGQLWKCKKIFCEFPKQATDVCNRVQPLQRPRPHPLLRSVERYSTAHNAYTRSLSLYFQSDPGRHRDRQHPATISLEISDVYISISQSTFAISAKTKSKAVDAATPESFPRVDLGLVRLSASFSWGKSEDFLLSFDVMTELRARETSEYLKPALLVGSLDYHPAEKSWLLDASLRTDGFNRGRLTAEAQVLKHE